MTAHRWFANTACPGDYLYSRFDDIAIAVNKKLNKTTVAPVVSGEIYRVRKNWNDPSSQIGAYNSLENAKIACDKAGSGYEVYNADGVAVYPVKSVANGDITLKRGAKGEKVKELQTLLDNLGYECEVDGSFGAATLKQVLEFQKDHDLAQDGSVGPKTWKALRAFKPYKVKVIALSLNVRKGPGTRYKIVSKAKRNQVYTIVKEQGNWGLLKSHNGWISLKYCKKV